MASTPDLPVQAFASLRANSLASAPVDRNRDRVRPGGVTVASRPAASNTTGLMNDVPVCITRPSCSTMRGNELRVPVADQRTNLAQRTGRGTGCRPRQRRSSRVARSMTMSRWRSPSGPRRLDRPPLEALRSRSVTHEMPLLPRRWTHLRGPSAVRPRSTSPPSSDTDTGRTGHRRAATRRSPP